MEETPGVCLKKCLDIPTWSVPMTNLVLTWSLDLVGCCLWRQILFWWLVDDRWYLMIKKERIWNQDSTHNIAFLLKASLACGWWKIMTLGLRGRWSRPLILVKDKYLLDLFYFLRTLLLFIFIIFIFAYPSCMHI